MYQDDSGVISLTMKLHRGLTNKSISNGVFFFFFFFFVVFFNFEKFTSKQLFKYHVFWTPL